MYPTDVLALSMADALAADTASLGAVLALHVHLVAAPFTPDGQTDVAALTLATFTGSAALAAGAAPQQVGVDPITNEVLVTLKEPAGGWRWECTVAPGVPETIVGYVVTDNADTDTFGSGLLAVPVPVSAVNHVVHIPDVTLRIPAPFAS